MMGPRGWVGRRVWLVSAGREAPFIFQDATVQRDQRAGPGDRSYGVKAFGGRFFVIGSTITPRGLGLSSFGPLLARGYIGQCYHIIQPVIPDGVGVLGTRGSVNSRLGVWQIPIGSTRGMNGLWNPRVISSAIMQGSVEPQGN